jgi:hypothetical protein
LIGLGVVAVLGCSSKNSPAPPAEPVAADAGANDAAPLADAEAPTADAGTDAPPGAQYPAPHHPLPQLKNRGGSVIASPELVTVTFAGNTQRDEIRAFNDMIIASDWWTAVTRGYGIAKGKGGLYAELEDTLSNTTIDDSDIGPLLQKQLDAQKLPPPNASSVYAINLPKLAKITLKLDDGQKVTSCQHFDSYHSSVALKRADGTTIQAAYAILPSCGQGGVYRSTSYMLIETVTDPNPFAIGGLPGYELVDNDAWVMFFGFGNNEVANLCAWSDTMTVGGHDVTRSWVNAAAKESKSPCQPSDPAQIYYGAAVETETATVHDPDGTTRLSDGYITLKRGAKKDVDVVIFSEAKLPSDVTLGVARPAGLITNEPTVPGFIVPGVAWSLSKLAGRNGDKVTLGLAADASTKPGDYLFIVRALVGSTDNPWPVILRVE